MDTPHPRSLLFTSFARLAGVIALVAAFVFGSAKLTVLLPAFGSGVFPVWFPAGVMLFAISRCGWRGSVGSLIGLFLFNAQLFDWWVALGVATGSCASYLVGAALLRRAGFRGRVDDLRETWRFVLVGAGLAPVLASINGPCWLVLGGQFPVADAWFAAIVWWCGDAVGVIAVAPALFLVPDRLMAYHQLPRLVVRDLASLFVIGALAGVVFSPGSPFADQHLPIAYLPVLGLSLAAFFMPACVASIGLLLTAVIGVLGTSYGAGPFSEYSPYCRSILIGLFVGSAGIVTLLVIGTRGIQMRDSAALAESAHEYRFLVDASPTLICRYDEGGRVLFANKTLKVFAGEVSHISCLGLPAARLVDEAEIECRCVGGRSRWLRWTSRAVGRTEDGAAHYLAVGIDVTARREAEAQRRAIEQQMFQTQKLESLGVIAGGVAHDFNNILTGVMGNAELARMTVPADSPAIPYLSQVVEAASRAAELNRQLLAYAGKGKFLVRPIDLNELVRQTVDLIRLSLPKKIEVRFDRWLHLPLVQGDASQLQQVLMNLLINAGDAIGDRAGLITVRTDVAVLSGNLLADLAPGQTPVPGRYASLTVTDTGAGMDPDTKAKIFEPFFTTKFTGRGLGLAAVQGIIRGHLGAMKVDTAPGIGSTFTVLLPEHQPGPVATPPRVDDTLTPMPYSRRNTVLVVDDEEAVRDLTSSILRSFGWRVVTAADGRIGVEEFRRHADQIACAVLDLTMPVMDGLEAMNALRLERPRLPVLICTGYTEASVPAAPPGAATRLLLKPFRPSDLRNALVELFADSASYPTPMP